MAVTEETDLHHRVLKRHYIEVGDDHWEVSTVRLIEEPESIGEVAGLLTDMVDGVTEKYETMIFKKVDGVRVSSIMGGANSFGHYRSNNSQDIVKAHHQIVSLIAEGKLTPVQTKENHGTTISKHILKAMMKEVPNNENQVVL